MAPETDSARSASVSAAGTATHQDPASQHVGDRRDGGDGKVSGSRSGHGRAILTRVKDVADDPDYRWSALAMFFQGCGMGSGMPFIGLFLVQRLHASTSTAGLFFTTALVGALVSYGTGMLSDRYRRRLALARFSCLWLAAGWLALSMVGHTWTVFVIGFVFFCFIGTLISQQYAHLHDVMDARRTQQRTGVLGVVRAAYSVGWAVGPAVGSWLSTGVGFGAAFRVTAVVYLLGLLCLTRMTARRPRPGTPGRDGAQPSPRVSRAVLLGPVLVAAGCSIVLSGDSTRLTFLPIELGSVLHLGPGIVGTVMSIPPVLEIVVIPAAGLLADRYGSAPILVGGSACGAAGFCALALSDTTMVFFLGQALVAVMVAATVSVGPAYAQRLAPAHIGVATSVYFGAVSLSSGLGGVVGGYSASVLGVPKLFLVPVAGCLVAMLFLVLASRSRRAR
ncbi:MAG: MFS transporter [Actinocatenispora sp.]